MSPLFTKEIKMELQKKIKIKFVKLFILLLVASLFLVAFAPVEQGIARFTSLITKTLVVTNAATFQDSVAFQNSVTFAGGIVQTGATTLDDVTLTGNIANRSLFLEYQDVSQAPSIYAAAEVISTTSSITTSILGIDTPRNVVLTLTSDAQRAAGNITVTGVDARGKSTTELLAMTAITDPETLTGNVPWASITSFTIPTQTNAFTLTVAGGQKFGLPLLPVAAGNLYHLTVAATPQAAPTVSVTYGTFDPVATPAAGVDYDVWIKQ